MHLDFKFLEKVAAEFSNENIEVEYLAGLKKTGNKEKDILAQLTGFVGFDAIEPCFLTLHSWSLYWKYLDDQVHLSLGNCSILGLREMLSADAYSGKKKKRGEFHKGYLWRKGEEELAIVKELEQDFLILDVVSLQDSIFGLVKFSKSGTTTYLFKYPHRLYPLTLSLCDYIEQAILHKGAYLWQEKFIDKVQFSEILWEVLANERLVISGLNNLVSEHGTLPSDFFRKVVSPSVFAQIERQSFRSKLQNRWTSFQSSLQLDEYCALNGASSWIPENISAIPFSPLTVQIVEREYEIQIPDEILAFFMQINGLNIQWRAKSRKNNERFLSAHYTFLNFYQVFGGDKVFDRRDRNDSFAYAFNPDLFKDESDYLLIRDSFLLGYSEFTALYFNPKEDFQLYCLYRGSLYRIHYSLSELLDVFIQSLGMDYWEFSLLGMDNVILANIGESFREHFFE